MNPLSYSFGIICALALLFTIIVQLRKGRLRERHAIWWLVAGVVALVFGVFPNLLDSISALVGVKLSSNLVFFAGIGILFFVVLQHSAELTKLEEKSRRLAEETSIQELQIKKLQTELGKIRRGNPKLATSSREDQPD